MARRMFSPQIVDSDAFLDMSSSAQNLYFHLGMRADDDGFVGNPKKIMRMLNIGEDDFKILIAKRFILNFESGVIVIKHWRINNLIRKDWYRETIYKEEKNLLGVKDNGSYTEKINLVNENVPNSLTQVRLGKVSKERERNSSINYLKEIPSEDLLEFYNRFDCDNLAIINKAESLYLYCQSKGKVYKNYKAFLLNALKKDFPERKEKPKNRKVVFIDGKPTLVN